MNDGDIKVVQNKFYWKYFRQNKVNLLVYESDRPYFKQNKKPILQNFTLLAFFKSITFYFLKKKEIKHNNRINKQSQEAFIVIIINYTFRVFLLCLLCKIIFFKKY